VDEWIVTVLMIIFGISIQDIMSTISLDAKTTLIDYPYSWI
jgi:hypothetical protein